jgi:hypothetical protein
VQAGRFGKAKGRNPDMYVVEESDRTIVPMKQPNKTADRVAEAAEGRVRTKKNVDQPDIRPTQGGERVSQGLGGVRRAARERKQERFTALLHHLDVDLLRESYYALKRSAAPGVDGVWWSEYEEGLEGRLLDLHDRVHRGAYRAQPGIPSGQNPVTAVNYVTSGSAQPIGAIASVTYGSGDSDSFNSSVYTGNLNSYQCGQ